VLVNSPGPHDHVRIRDPFQTLQGLGVDCRIHERPFRFNSCIRPHSLVIWQRPLPESRLRQWEHLQWLRERGCLLLTEWDDHPHLFPASIRAPLEAMAMAPLELCHGLHTSSARLAFELGAIQPLAVVLENHVANIPALNLKKHSTQQIRVLVANQNRSPEHQAISDALLQWVQRCAGIQVVVVADRELAAKFPSNQRDYYPTLNYQSYRELLRSCHIALLPLAQGTANACKTPIKLLECAAESVAAVCGPELYGRSAPAEVATVVDALEAVVPTAQAVAQDLQGRQQQVEQAHRWVQTHWAIDSGLATRLWLYQQMWTRRRQLDQRLVARLHKDSTLPTMRSEEFGGGGNQP